MLVPSLEITVPISGLLLLMYAPPPQVMAAFTRRSETPASSRHRWALSGQKDTAGLRMMSNLFSGCDVGVEAADRVRRDLTVEPRGNGYQMSEGNDAVQVVAVAAGLEQFSGQQAAPGAEHRRLDVFIGKWINSTGAAPEGIQWRDQ